MSASSWILRTNPTSKVKVEKWLAVEATNEYDIVANSNEVQVDFKGIDDAFRFRLQFDEELVD